jgi:tRNA(Ile)-lysidine synthase TilS/MesJ
LRKFGMIKHGDIVGVKRGNGFKEIVLEHLLIFASEKYNFELVRLPNTKANKIAVDDSIDSESEDIVNILIKENSSKLKRDLPVEGKIIKPLYLFLDEEILLYARLKKLGFSRNVLRKKDKIESFIDDFEKKHPEVKRAVVNSLLEIYMKTT